MSQQQPRPSRPTTPLRRISSHSLRSLSLSHSQSQSHASHPSNDDDALAHLSPVFSELADSVSDLVANCERLGEISFNLDRFNEAFASYLYGLRINSYTFDFKHPPNKINFQLAQQRRLERVASPPPATGSEHPRDDARDVQGDDDGEDDDRDRTAMFGGSGAADSTFVTNDEHSFIQPAAASSSRGARGGRGSGRGIARGTSSGIARGRAKMGTTAAVMTRRRKEEIAAFADPVFPLLPINLRENRRRECENVLWALKENASGGIGLSDLTKQLATCTPPIPQFRINEVLLALVRAKVATKGLVKGVNVYRLDPSRIA